MIATSSLYASLKKQVWLATVLLLGVGLTGCSSVEILQPVDGAILSAGEPIQFVGQVERSWQTGGEDRSDELEWDSSRDGHLANGKQFTTSTLSTGSHRITATWPGKNRRDWIFVSVGP